MLSFYKDEYQQITFDGQHYEWSDINGHSFVLKDEMDARIYAAQLEVEHKTIEMCGKLEDRFEEVCVALEEKIENLEREIAYLTWRGVGQYENMNR